MKRTTAPVIAMTVISVFLLLSFVAQGQTATATVSETIVFDYGEDKYVSSRDGLVDNHYKSIKIIEEKNVLTFIFTKNDNSCKMSQYKITKRKRNSDILIAKRLGDNAQIRIDQSREGRMEIQCNHQSGPSRYDGAFILTNVKFI